MINAEIREFENDIINYVNNSGKNKRLAGPLYINRR